jgi:hypothetical protein
MEQMDLETMRLFHKWVNRHLVILVVTYTHLDKGGKPTGVSRVTACSGSILSVGESWFFVTAGHVIEELDELYLHPSVRIDGACFIDSLGLQSTYDSPIPFNYGLSARHARNEDGLDYGFIELSSNDRQLMLKNPVEPIPLGNWVHQDIDKCDTFALLGIPKDTVSLETRDEPGVNLGTAWISLTRLKELPEGADTTAYDRFIGDIGKKHSHNLEGTSGGPIIGFAHIEGQIYYWIVALQSTCLKNRYVFGCPTKLIGQIILENLQELSGKIHDGE